MTELMGDKNFHHMREKEGGKDKKEKKNRRRRGIVGEKMGKVHERERKRA